MYFIVLTVLSAFSIMLFILKVDGQSCNPLYGPAGSAECVPLGPDYIGYQWAVCLSDSYIQLKSKGKHICDPVYRPLYCWYQCMLEMYGQETGLVYGSCSCTPGQVPPSISPVSNTDGASDDSLPDSCFSPSGDDCNWYRDCLERRHSCSDSSNGYAISYAEKFCNLYSDRFDHFTRLGQQWVDAVRKCLQVALVPEIRPWANPTCAELKQTAFNSHTSCYTEPFADAPSICDLGCKDWFQTMWTIKSGFSQAFVESMKGLVEVVYSCGKRLDLLDDSCPTGVLKVLLSTALLRRTGRSTSLEVDALAGDVAEEIADRLKWDKKVMDWYAFANISDDSASESSFEISIMIGDLGKLQLTSFLDESFDLRQTVNSLANAVKNGYMYDIIVDGKNISVASLSACEDLECAETFADTVAGPRRSDAGILFANVAFMTYILIMFQVSSDLFSILL